MMKWISLNGIIEFNIAGITQEAVSGTGYTAFIRQFYMGKQYFLFVNEVFRDVRLVGASPSSIGKFGGETDNWVWPLLIRRKSMRRVSPNG